MDCAISLSTTTQQIQPDCYHDPDICAEDEWCNIDVHDRWGPWAFDENGTTFLDNDNGLCNIPEYYNSTDLEGEKTHGP
ncbi:hypothetical protein SARC_07393 [Sphaeroforma arctica JP610]|uniref:Uncharacterized protein n=1 Tax=Sphaeroforma arctica JP610 TaxID=667725 RepID=A0A0L0FTT3_9EUKA|nr:hypothetical protein SARC_07393 [Sphaeroforma arctica JP610]KNC80240.1 hypothetical protein SARC_07393 [Sphaeroforma arctica JP610]|eukprot:XP_014154142.1 hypothetical protein SARC_07393 [Sphaeroforma arctica JP610]